MSAPSGVGELGHAVQMSAASSTGTLGRAVQMSAASATGAPSSRRAAPGASRCAGGFRSSCALAGIRSRRARGLDCPAI
jgi:hypothetical protein